MTDPEDWGTIPEYLKKDTPLGGTPEYPGFVFRYRPAPYIRGSYVGVSKMVPDPEGKYFDESLLNYHHDVVDGLRAHIAKLDEQVTLLKKMVVEQGNHKIMRDRAEALAAERLGTIEAALKRNKVLSDRIKELEHYQKLYLGMV